MSDEAGAGFRVEDGEESRNETLGIKSIALEQYRRCCIEGSKEMTRAGTMTKLVNGKYYEIEVPDQREIFINSVISLKIVLCPNIPLHKNIKNKIGDLQKEIDKVEDKYKKSLDGQLKQNKTLPSSYYENLKDSLFSELIFHYRKMLEALSLLLNELKYFDEAGSGA